jgi:hypothetical protein
MSRPAPPSAKKRPATKEAPEMAETKARARIPNGLDGGKNAPSFPLVIDCRSVHSDALAHWP